MTHGGASETGTTLAIIYYEEWLKELDEWVKEGTKMKRLSMSLGAVGVALMLIAAAVGLLQDSTMFTSPPEAVAEGFVRQLVEGRFEQAEEYLSDSMSAQISQDDLEHLAFFIMMRSGEILEVKGTRGPMAEREAMAVAHMRTSQAGEWALSLHMVRDHGVWSIDRIGSARQTRMQESIFGIPIPGIIALMSPGLAQEMTRGEA